MYSFAYFFRFRRNQQSYLNGSIFVFSLRLTPVQNKHINFNTKQLSSPNPKNCSSRRFQGFCRREKKTVTIYQHCNKATSSMRVLVRPLESTLFGSSIQIFFLNRNVSSSPKAINIRNELVSFRGRDDIKADFSLPSRKSQCPNEQSGNFLLPYDAGRFVFLRDSRMIFRFRTRSFFRHGRCYCVSIGTLAFLFQP